MAPMRPFENVLRWIVIAGVFVLPFVALVVSSSLFFPYITGKNFLFRVVVEVVAGAWLALALINPHYRPRKSWILAAFAAFVLIIAAADALGAYPFKSFWSNYERMDGWVTIAHLLAYTVVAATVLNAEQLWRRLFHVSLGVSLFISIYGLLPLMAAALGESGTGNLIARIDATFGNPIYMAAYMLFHVFIAAMLMFQDGKIHWGKAERIIFPVAMAFALANLLSQSTHGGGTWTLYVIIVAALVGLLFLRRAYLYLFVIVFDIIALLFTGTRGTTVGLVGGILLTAVLLALFSKQPQIRKWSAGLCAAVVVLVGGFWLIRDAAWIQQIGFLQRLATISATDNTTQARFLNWQIAWEGVKERPILGWGQENYAIVFDKYYDPRMYAQEQWFDRVHNIVFDWLVAGGFLGLISYLAIFGITLWVLWRPRFERGSTEAGLSNVRQDSSTFSVEERSILTGLLAGYFVHNFFVFDNVTSYILFGTILAYVVWRDSEAAKSPRLLEGVLVGKHKLAPYFIAGACAVFTLGVVWAVNGNAHAANRTLLSALRGQSSLETNLAYFTKAINYGSYGSQEAREQLSQVASQLTAAQGIPNSTKQLFFDMATKQLALQAAASPLDARFPLFLGVVRDAYGDYANAKIAIEKAHELSPGKQTILYELAMNAQARGDNEGALRAVKQAYDLETSNPQAAVLYASTLIRLGNEAEADRVLAPFIASGQAADPRVAQAYALRSRFDKIITIWEARIIAVPTDANSYFILAASYYEAKQPAKAIVVLEKLIQQSPTSAAQANVFIAQIKSGTLRLQ